MKPRWGTTAIIGLVVIFSIATIGISYASIGYPNPGGISLCTFSRAESNDDGTAGSCGGYNPIDPGDSGPDPSQSQTPGISCVRFANDIATTTVALAADTLTISLDNAYPGYHPTIFFEISNQTPNPGIVQAISFNNPDPTSFTMTVTGISQSQVIDSGKGALAALDITCGNLPRGKTTNSYTLLATVVVTQYVAQTTTTISSSPNPSQAGQSVTFNVTVRGEPATLTPTGMVSFNDGTTLLGTAALNSSGQASYDTSALAEGVHSLNVVYGGDAIYFGSSAAITQTVNSNGGGGGGGGGAGGGGGGGGGGGTTNPGAVDLAGYMSSPGRIGYDVFVKSGSGRLTLTLPRGTALGSADGSPVTFVKIIDMAPTDSSPFDISSVVGLVYDMIPHGATFSPPIPLKISYDPATIPSGASQDKLVIAYWDSANNKWMALNDSQVDNANHVVTAHISRFGLYALAVNRATATVTTSLATPIITPTPTVTATLPSASKPTLTSTPVPTSALPLSKVPPAEEQPLPMPASDSTESLNWTVVGVLSILGMILGFIIPWFKPRKSQ